MRWADMDHDERAAYVGPDSPREKEMHRWRFGLTDRYPKLNLRVVQHWVPMANVTTLIQKLDKSISWWDKALEFQLEVIEDQYPYAFERFFQSNPEVHRDIRRWISFHERCSETKKREGKAHIKLYGIRQDIDDLKHLQHCFEASHPILFDSRPYGFHSVYQKWSWADRIWESIRKEYLDLHGDEYGYFDSRKQMLESWNDENWYPDMEIDTA